MKIKTKIYSCFLNLKILGLLVPTLSLDRDQIMRGGRAAFGAMAMVTTAVVVYIHYGQRIERSRMREGVYKDIERMNQKQFQPDEIK
jgi:hypothetical protein